jgi:hypothetical protein
MNGQAVRGPLSARGLPDADQARIGLFTLVGAVVTLVTLLVAIAVATWQSYQEWGALPGTTGNGIILYGGVAVAIVATSLYVIWAWLKWRDPNAD